MKKKNPKNKHHLLSKKDKLEEAKTKKKVLAVK